MITETGLVRPTFNELKESYIEALRNVFEKDPNSPKLNVASNTPLGHLIDLRALEMSDVWDMLEVIFNAINLDSAEGLMLDFIGKIKGITRYEEAAPVVALTFIQLYERLIDSNLSIPIGTQATDTFQNITYTTSKTISLSTNTSYNEAMLNFVAPSENTTYTITINSNVFIMTASDSSTMNSELLRISGEIAATMQGMECLVFNNTNAPSWNAVAVEDSNYRLSLKWNTLFKSNYRMFNNNSGVITDVVPLYVGMDVSSYGDYGDTNFSGSYAPLSNETAALAVQNRSNGQPGYARESDADYRERLRTQSSNNVNYTEQAILAAVSAVTNVSFASIISNRTMGIEKGLPPKSFSVTVTGGDEQQIAEAIAASAPPGIESFGSIQRIVTNSFGIEELISFNVSASVFVYLRITYTLYTEEEMPANGEDLIKQAILEWAKREYSPGKDVILSRIFTPIYTVPGLQVMNIEVGTNENLGSVDSPSKSPTMDTTGTLTEDKVYWEKKKIEVASNETANVNMNRIWFRVV